MSETEKVKKNYLPRYRGHSRLAKTGNSGNLSVPSDMMSVLTEGLLFKPELTKDGILFRIVDENKIAAEDKAIPAWVKKVGGTSSTGSKTAVSEPDTDSDPDDPETDDAVVDEGDTDEDETEPPDDDDTPF